MAGADLGTLIPPSIVFIIYGFITGASIGKLFMGGLIPGIILSFAYCSYVVARSMINPKLCPPLSREERQISFRQKIALSKGIILPIMLIIFVLGSIYGGLATPTEAGAVGSIGALLTAVIHRKFNWKLVRDSLYVTVEATCMIIWIAFGSLSFAAVFGIAGGIEFIRKLMMALPVSPLVIILFMMLIFFILGLVMEWLAIAFLTLPLFAPIVEAMGFDLTWFGVLFVMNIQIAYISPPFAQAVFYVKGVAPPEISISDLYRSVWAFIAIIFVCLLLVVFFPQIALWLPGKMMG